MALIGIAEGRSALAWWLEAGVDIAVQEEPRNWLKPASPRTQPKTADPPLAEPNVAPPSHETLAALQDRNVLPVINENKVFLPTWGSPMSAIFINQKAS